MKLLCCYSAATDVHVPEPTPSPAGPEMECLVEPCPEVEDAPCMTYGQVRRHSGLLYHRYCYWRVMSGCRCVHSFLDQYDFLARDSIYAIARYMPSPVRLSVCLSVRLSHGWISQRRLKLGSRNFHHRVAP